MPFITRKAFDWQSLGVLLVLTASCDLAAESKNGFVLDEALVPIDEIMHGGPGRDGIPSLDYPEFLTAAEADYLKPKDRILGLQIDGIARAYPIRVLNYHEIVNDAFGGRAVVVTYCPLCLSGMAFDAKVGGNRLEFGVSGLLFHSDVLLYDRQTGSLWSQIMQTAISGKMKGTKLEAMPMTHTTWRDWLLRHPETEVLSDRTGYRRNYRVDPYPAYRRDSRLFFPVAAEDDRYPRKSIVLGLEVDGRFKAYPFRELDKSPPSFTDEFEGRRFEILYDRKNETARVIAENGEEWASLISYWFAWYAFHPDTEVYTAD